MYYDGYQMHGTYHDRRKSVERENKKGLRMRELMEATGLPKSTILHYVAQGLLPEPVRTGRNMAYYDAACVERAKFIKKVQGTYSFPLEKIKKLLVVADEGGHSTLRRIECGDIRHARGAGAESGGLSAGYGPYG